MLENVGLRYTLIDLGSAGVAARIKAKIDGVNSTPTLIYKEHKLKGVQQITKMLQTIIDTQQK